VGKHGDVADGAQPFDALIAMALLTRGGPTTTRRQSTMKSSQRKNGQIRQKSFGRANLSPTTSSASPQ
jgi:hypothetical protein